MSSEAPEKQNPKKLKTEKQKQQERRDVRVAKALRDNLRRRKVAIKKAKAPKS